MLDERIGGHPGLESKVALITVAGQRRICTVCLRHAAGILSPFPPVAVPHQNRSTLEPYHFLGLIQEIAPIVPDHFLAELGDKQQLKL